VAEAGEGEADDVEVAALDAANVAAGTALDGVGAGFVERLLGGEIASELFGGERGEVHVGGFDEAAALGVGKADEGDASDDGMHVAGEFGEHVVCVIAGAGLAEDVSIEEDDGIRGDYDGRTHGARGNELGFSVGETLNEIVRGFAGNIGFVDSGREHHEGQASGAKDLGAADGCRRENELNGRHVAARILHTGRRDSLCFGASLKRCRDAPR
jgi:hypothetical protein